MTPLIEIEFTSLANGIRVCTIRMTAPRSNALTPALLRALDDALDQAEAANADAILLAGRRNFSTGGDVGAFFQAYETGRARAYAQEIVSLLQDLVHRLLSMPALVIAAPRGAITGGSCGLLFASDMAVGAPDVFLQAYYAKVGFAPDGGWTAILPERVGVGPAQAFLHADRRLDVQALRDLELLTAVSETPEDAALSILSQDVLSARQTAKRLLWDGPRLAVVRTRLDAETRAFVDRIETPEVVAGMRRFIHGSRTAAHA